MRSKDKRILAKRKLKKTILNNSKSTVAETKLIENVNVNRVPRQNHFSQLEWYDVVLKPNETIDKYLDPKFDKKKIRRL